jgi:hypothetical protein
MHVEILAEGRHEGLVARDVGQDPELDLGVVGRQE